MTAHEVLIGVGNVLSDESKWMKHRLAADATGATVDPESDGACRWCLMGAVLRVMFRAGPVFDDPTKTMRAVKFALAASEAGLVSCFNDEPDTKFSDVKRTIDTAIEVTKRK